MIHHNNSSNGTEWLLVEVPKESKYRYINGYGDHLCYSMPNEAGVNTIQLPVGEWELFCKASTATDEQAAEIVDSKGYNLLNYMDYNPGNRVGFTRATNSLQSLLISHNLTPSTTLIIKKLK